MTEDRECDRTPAKLAKESSGASSGPRLTSTAFSQRKVSHRRHISARPSPLPEPETPLQLKPGRSSEPDSKAGGTRGTAETGSNHDTLEQPAKGQEKIGLGSRNYLLRIGVQRKNRKLFPILNRSVKDCFVCNSRCSQRTVIQRNLTKKYMTTKDAFNVKIVNDIIYNEATHVVSTFKDYLIYDDPGEFLKRFYAHHESSARLPKVYDFYDKYSQVFANYIALPEKEYMFKNIERKQRLIDLQQRNTASQTHRRQSEDATQANKEECIQIATTTFREGLARDDAERSMMQSYLKGSGNPGTHKKTMENMKLSEIVEAFIAKDSQSIIDVSQVLKSIDGRENSLFPGASPADKIKIDTKAVVVSAKPLRKASPQTSRNAIVLSAVRPGSPVIEPLLTGRRVSHRVPSASSSRASSQPRASSGTRASPAQTRYASTRAGGARGHIEAIYQTLRPQKKLYSGSPAPASVAAKVVPRPSPEKVKTRFPAYIAKKEGWCSGSNSNSTRSRRQALQTNSAKTLRPAQTQRSTSTNGRQKVLQIDCIVDIYKGRQQPAGSSISHKPSAAPRPTFKSKFLNTLQKKHQLEYPQVAAGANPEQQRFSLGAVRKKQLAASRSTSSLRARPQQLFQRTAHATSSKASSRKTLTIKL